jgi:hypothetical protein
MFSNNYVIPSDRFKVFGEPKEISKIADSGNRIVNCFCGDCGKLILLRDYLMSFYASMLCVSLAKTNSIPGTTMYRWGDGFGGKDGMRIIQPGILDDKNVIDDFLPDLEMFTGDRVKWIGAIDGLAQHEKMP